ncbi:patatin-like phospholipase family protein [Phycicoccus flavus]|uniref:patatin-like phospholipase family protein n=1 Tax=Phycicoccus flavus TaxID=2502783 RepID=UPI000FEB7DF8|nr:patatin-like phospholipase family protein [Phycicoccus flavus]NHA67119.1 hypothetical protein [Phycicoccus flavus]
MTTTALVLDAGGARSGYQVGVLQVLLPALDDLGARPRVLVGSSAGGLIAAAVAATARRTVADQVEALGTLLGHGTKPRVMRPLWRQLPEMALRYASETVGWSGFRLRGIIDTGPLAATLREHVDWGALHDNLADGTAVDTLAVTASSVRTGRVVLFTEGGRPLPDLPADRHRHYVRTRLTTDHLMASAAVPVLFPSVHVTEPAAAADWYVDGATRRRTPLAPALDLGADRVVAVGTGRREAPESAPRDDGRDVDLADSAATLLGAVMDDPLRHDLRRLRETNVLAGDRGLATALARAGGSDRPLREVPYVGIAPRDGDALAAAALDTFRRNHGSLRATLRDPDLQIVHRILGSDSPLQGELLSYLMFDPDFSAVAADLGRKDARAWLREHPGVFVT